MKIAVYSICLNEEKFAERYCKSIVNVADHVIVCDTGSSDNTVANLNRFGATVHKIVVSPWRFDMARNVSLAMIPKDVDVCIKLDLDESLPSGWRQMIESAWKSDTTRLSHYMADQYDKNDKPTKTYNRSVIHIRSGYYWKYHCHEQLAWDGEGPERTEHTKLAIEHRQDTTKSRGSYLRLLEKTVAEFNDPRHVFWLGREYRWNKQPQKCIDAMEQYLTKATWPAEKACALRFAGMSYLSLKQTGKAIQYCMRACIECPNDREPWMHMAYLYGTIGDWGKALPMAQMAKQIKVRGSHYLIESHLWAGGVESFISKCLDRLKSA